jgi:hypothetical protein
MEFHLLLRDDGLDLIVLGTDDLEQIFSESLCACDLLFIWATNASSSVRVGQRMQSGHERDVNVHGLVSFPPSLLVHETRADALDLHPRLCLLLNVFHKNTLTPC